MFSSFRSQASPAREFRPQASSSREINSSLRKSPISNSRKRASSPFSKDRYLPSSPHRGVSMENIRPPNLCDPYSKSSPANTPGTPKSPIRTFQKPQISSTLLDAVGLNTTSPSQLIDFNQDGVLAVALGNTVYLWSETMQSCQFREFEVNISALAWTQSGLVLSGQGHVELYDAKTAEVINVFDDHVGDCTSISSSGYRLATGGVDGYVKIYDLRAETITQGNVHHGGISKLNWSPDGLMLAAAGHFTNQISILASGIHKVQRKKISLKSPIGGMQWLGSNYLFVGEKDNNGSIHRFTIKNEGEDGLYLSGLPVHGLGWTDPYGLFVAHGDTRGSWELLTPDFHQTIEVTDGHEAPILNMTVSQDQVHMATISLDESLHIWSLKPNVKSPSRTSNSPFRFRRSPSPSQNRNVQSQFSMTSFSSYQSLR